MLPQEGNEWSPGVLEASRSWDVSSPIDGYIIAINFSEGDVVSKGDLLVEFDSQIAEFQLSLAKINASLAEATFADRQADLERQKTLRDHENVSVATFLDTKLAAHVAALEVERAKIEMEIAAIYLEAHLITSPADGLISGPLVNEASIYNAEGSGPIATVVQLDPINVRVAVPLGEVLSRLKRGEFNIEAVRELEFELFLEDDTEYFHKGKIVAVGFEVDPNSGEGSVLLEFPNPEGVLRPGLPVKVK